MSTLDVQNECQAVISLASPLSAKHWKEYVEEEWTELTQGITGQFRMLVLAGVHGGKGGEIGKVSDNIEDIKGQIVEWLRKELHWIKADYIQAKRISNIGILFGTYNAVDKAGTRTALENAVFRRPPVALRSTSSRAAFAGSDTDLSPGAGVRSGKQSRDLRHTCPPPRSL